MSIITLHKYRKSDGAYISTEQGVADYVLEDIGSDYDFTTTPPPDNSKQWRWIDGAWV